MGLAFRWCFLLSFAIPRTKSQHQPRRLKGGAGPYDFKPTFDGYSELKKSALDPWPHGTEQDNLCEIIKTRNVTATIVMASDGGYEARVERCVRKDWVPKTYNAAYADKHGYALRFYVDEEVPFVMKHGKNALMGELRKIFGLADAMRPSGPDFGRWVTRTQHIKPDLVMWVDGDAHIAGEQSKQMEPLTIQEVVHRACGRAEYPENFVRIIGQDSGNNVNAGWYIMSSGSFGSHFLKYILELFEVYGPCEM